jgi:hypothetical protein
VAVTTVGRVKVMGIRDNGGPRSRETVREDRQWRLKKGRRL